VSGRPELPVPSAQERRALVEERLDAVARLLAGRGAAGVILTSRRDFAWLTAGGLNHVVLASESGAAPVLVTRDGAVVLAPVNEAARIADEELSGLPLSVEELPWWQPEAAADVARRHLGAADILDEGEIAEELTALRQRLAPLEHERLEWLGALARQTVDDALAGCERGATEHELAAAAVEAGSRAGARLPVLLVAADERIDQYRHPLPTDHTLRHRVMLVVVVERWGMHAALTGIRELEPVSEDGGRRAAAVDELLLTMREATVPGRTLGDVLAAAQVAYAKLGFADEWRLHHQGGTIGYQGRERIATPADPAPIESGMAFSWNPSVRGQKAEETFYLDQAGRAHGVTDRQ